MTETAQEETATAAGRSAGPVKTLARLAARLRKPAAGRGDVQALSRPAMIGLSIIGGIVAGLGAVLFRDLIGLFHNLFFLGRFTVAYDASAHTPAGPWGPLVILVPAVGAVGVTFLVTRFAPEAKGHGVPEVMDSVHYGKGIIRPAVAVVKALASALCIGSGGSVGREGPIVQIGSSFGSMIGQLLPMTQKQRITLLAAGAAGGIAATFNTPIGGILFAVELILNEVSTATLVPVAICTITATYIGRLFFGLHPSFVIPHLTGPYSSLESPQLLLSYVVLGILMGGASALTVKTLYFLEDFFGAHSFKNPYLKHASAMLLVGAVFYALLRFTGSYHVEGVGYATIQDILTGGLSSLPLLLMLFVTKLGATSITLGSGGSGGVFSPSLFLGAAAGSIYGIVLRLIFPSLGIRPEAFAVTGMAGMIGGTTGAALTSIVMVFEMTLDYSAIVPISIVVAFAYAVRKALLRESIYTMKLARRGRIMPDAFRVGFLSMKKAGDLMSRTTVSVPAAASLARLRRTAAAHPEAQWILVTARGFVVGVDSRGDILDDSPRARYRRGFAEEVMRPYSTCSEEESVFDIAARMRSEGTLVTLVTAAPHSSVKVADVRGLVGRERMGDIVDEYVDFYADGSR